MPGLFGGIGCANSDVYAWLRAEFVKIWGDCDSREGQDWALGGHAFAARQALISTARYCYAVDGEYSVYTRPTGGQGGPRHDFHINKGTLHLGPNHSGNIALIDTADRTLHLAAEWTGTFPLYFVNYDSGLLFSSHLRPLARVTKKPVDELGLLEFLRNGYLLAGRSVFAGIQRVLPGQSVRFSEHRRLIEATETNSAWTADERFDSPDVIAEETWRLLNEAVGRAVPLTGCVGLMMSAGWDSRTLLTVLNDHAAGRILCYSHGDTASRELRIATRLADSYHSDCRLEPIDVRVLDLNELERGFNRVENVVFPHWHRAGRILADIGVACTTAGVYGEVMGGHYGPSMLLGGHRTILEVGSSLIRRPGRAYGYRRTGEPVESLLRVKPFGQHWYLRREFEDAISSACARMNADVEADLVRLRRRGIRSPNRLTEAFIAEHRGSQYINAQLLSCRAHIDILLPFGDQALLSLVSCVPIHAKIHNTLNRRMLQRHAPGMLRFPMAATLVPASAPLFLQEGSRLVRKSYENARLALYLRTRGRIRRARLGWVDFEFLRSGDAMMPLVEDLRSDYWDRDALRRRISALVRDRKGEQLHPFYDQLSKIYTADLFCR